MKKFDVEKMIEKMKEVVKSYVNNIEKELDSDLDVEYFLKNYKDLDDFENFAEDFYDYIIENGILNVDIIYYSKAINYLSKNDASLRDSLEIAIEYGYSIENLNSEILASLLATQNNIENFENNFDVDELQEMIDDVVEV